MQEVAPSTRDDGSGAGNEHPGTASEYQRRYHTLFGERERLLTLVVLACRAATAALVKSIHSAVTDSFVGD